MDLFVLSSPQRAITGMRVISGTWDLKNTGKSDAPHSKKSRRKCF
jgi:hypothetical protein